MLSLDDWRQVIDVNLNGLYNVLHPIVLPMVRRRKAGRIITISSVSGLMGNGGQVNYSASKSGIIGATKALAIELAKKQITVNCVAPGLIESDMTDNLSLEKIVEAIPVRRIGRAEEVAALVAFLCSPDAGYITRQVISVNGGLC
jgi:3-oxoacyl-[acyl-carrier protein] reductase